MADRDICAVIDHALETVLDAIVADLRAHFALMDAFVAPGSVLFLETPNADVAGLIDELLTEDERPRIRFNWPGKEAAA